MRDYYKSLVWIVLLLSLSGCISFYTGSGIVSGLLYQSTVEPLDENLDRSKFVDQAQQGDIKHFQFDMVDLRWDSNAIGDLVKAHGMDTVYFADVETFSILLGIWSQDIVHVYGR